MSEDQANTMLVLLREILSELREPRLKQEGKRKGPLPGDPAKVRPEVLAKVARRMHRAAG